MLITMVPSSQTYTCKEEKKQKDHSSSYKKPNYIFTASMFVIELDKTAQHCIWRIYT